MKEYLLFNMADSYQRALNTKAKKLSVAYKEDASGPDAGGGMIGYIVGTIVSIITNIIKFIFNLIDYLINELKIVERIISLIMLLFNQGPYVYGESRSFSEVAKNKRPTYNIEIVDTEILINYIKDKRNIIKKSSRHFESVYGSTFLTCLKKILNPSAIANMSVYDEKYLIKNSNNVEKLLNDELNHYDENMNSLTNISNVTKMRKIIIRNEDDRFKSLEKMKDAFTELKLLYEDTIEYNKKTKEVYSRLKQMLENKASLPKEQNDVNVRIYNYGRELLPVILMSSYNELKLLSELNNVMSENVRALNNK